MLEGFEDGYTDVNDTRLHYVTGAPSPSWTAGPAPGTASTRSCPPWPGVFASSPSTAEATEKLAIWKGGPFSDLFLDIVEGLPAKLLTGRFRHLVVYRTFHQDKADNDTYPPLRMPVLAIGGQYLDARYVTVEDTGHFVAEEQPGALAAELEKLFG
ncbi:hypothetical protein DF268_44815 [Streptomyces sp. V2]|uniref:alpha/beta fold hydrolase n=1 Tax=Streptomyces sp. V2 TaxID=1424099 RepID=UPI000D671497|nr:hypothetical protein [Streptomyces sp. V2]PWG07147.1 hypothetical protein DF268_44815 [Streptomyces sp. V2]